jgi:hypothetical protein
MAINRLCAALVALGEVREDPDFGPDARRQIQAVEQLVERFNAILARPELFDGQHSRALRLLFGRAMADQRHAMFVTGILTRRAEDDRRWTQLSSRLCASVGWPLPRPLATASISSECSPDLAAGNLAMGGIYLGDDYVPEYTANLLHCFGHILIEGQHQSLVVETARNYVGVFDDPRFLAGAIEPIDDESTLPLGLSEQVPDWMPSNPYSIPAPPDPQVMLLEIACDVVATYVLGRPYLLELALHATEIRRRLYSKGCLHLPAVRAALAALGLPDVPRSSFDFMVDDCGMESLPTAVFEQVAGRVVALCRGHGVRAAPDSAAADPGGPVVAAEAHWAQNGML